MNPIAKWFADVDVLDGLRRLGVILFGLAGVAVLLGLALATSDRTSARSGLAAGSGIVGVVLVILGVGAFTRTGTLAARRSLVRNGAIDHPSTGNAEPLAFGLLTLGATFSAISLAIG